MIKEELKIGAVVPVYNRERYIGPFLEMMDDFGVTCAVTLGDGPWTSQGGDEIKQPDKTERILDKYFSHMRILKGTYNHHKDSLNRGIERLQDCDIVFVNDCDMFITKKDWNDGLDFILDNWNNYEIFAINFEKMIKEYYFSHLYGRVAKPGGYPPIMAIKSKVRMKSMIKTHGGEQIVWDVETIKYHHMRYCKPTGSGKKYSNKPTSESYNMKDFTPVPKEITDRIEKWESIVNKL